MLTKTLYAKLAMPVEGRQKSWAVMEASMLQEAEGSPHH